VLARVGTSAVGLGWAEGVSGGTGNTNPRTAGPWLAECSFRGPVVLGKMERHRPRMHRPAQGLAAGVPYPSTASLRSCPEGKMQRRRGPQYPLLSGGVEEPGEKRPKFVSV
jgi:hypothetical protein